MMGILGGTFDPIHCGHLYISHTLSQMLGLDSLRFVPCKNPLFGKSVTASAAHRLAMLQRALRPYPSYVIDDRELKRDTPSYTVDTLIALRREFPDVPLAWIIGSDNLVHLDRWHDWQSLLHYAHLVVVPRRSEAYNPAILAFIAQFQTQDASLLSQQTAGLLLITQIKPLPISSSQIRAQIAKGIYLTQLLPSTVLDYILEQQLYAHDTHKHR